MKQILSLLDKYVPEAKPSLIFYDPYTLLIGVLLSAQCTDVRVNKVTKELFAKAKTPQEMIQLSVEEIRSIIRPCGLSKRKAEAISKLSHILIKKFKGKVPRTFEALESLPGVGHKTASVVMIQAFNKDAFPVDTHIFRLAKRWGLTKAKTREGAERDLKKVFPKKTWGRVHLQMITFGREHCKARGHDGDKCPICSEIQRSAKRLAE